MQERVQIHVPQKELGEKCTWSMGAQTPPGSGSLYRVPAAPRLAVLCHFPALFLPTLVERGDEQEQGGWPGCGAKPSLKEGLGEPSRWRRPWAALLERRLTADLSGRVLWDHGVGGELGVQDAAMCVGVHGERVQQLPVLQHPRVQQAARLGDQLGDVFCEGKGKAVSGTWGGLKHLLVAH